MIRSVFFSFSFLVITILVVILRIFHIPCEFLTAFALGLAVGAHIGSFLDDFNRWRIFSYRKAELDKLIKNK